MDLAKYYEDLEQALLRKCYQDVIQELMRLEILEEELEHCVSHHTECSQSCLALFEYAFDGPKIEKKN